jgi:HSP20 family protein
MLTRRTRTPGLGRLRSDLDSLFSRFFDDWGDVNPAHAGTYWPAVDISEREDDLLVRAELPGMTADDIDIEVEGHSLMIRGEKKDETEESGERYHYVERRSGSFQRMIQLPNEVDAEKIDASYKDGVLTVTLPKSEAAKPKRISVKQA